MSGVFRAVGAIASVASVVLMFVPGAQPIALGLKAAQVAAIAGATAAAAGIGAQLTAKRPSNERQGLQLNFKIDPGAPIPYVVGRTAVGGTIVHHETYGTDNHYNTYFAVLSGGGPSRAIEAFTADRAVVPFSGTSAQGYYARWLWQDRQLGATPEARALGHGVVNPPFGSIPATVPGWGTAYKLSGYTAASITMLFDTKARRYANGEPLPGWIVQGPFVYDPRLDSTYPGGSGPCRIDQPSTWVWSETPALHALKWRLGIFHNGKRIMGVGAPVDLIDLPRIVEAANVQETNGWKAGGELNSGMDRWDALKMIEQAGGAEPIANGAMMSTLQKMPRVSIGRIETKDVIGDSMAIPGTRPRRERINGFRARFRSEPHGWEMVPIDIVQVPQYVAEDGREVTGSGDYDLVQNPDQAASLAAYEVFDSRELMPIQLDVGPRFIGYRIGDCVTVDVPELLLEEQDCIIRGRSIDPATGVVTLKLATETAGKHAAALGQTGTPPPTPTLHYDPLDVPAPDAADWDALGGTVADGDFETPALIITGAVANSAADGVVFDYRLTGSGDDAWTGASIESADTTRKVITGVLPETSYDVGIRYKVTGVIGDRLVLGPCVTGIDGATELALFAQTLANGKSTIFPQPTPPTAAESKENDYWIDTDDGNKPYIRLAGDGTLGLGASQLLLGDAPLLIAPWASIEDERTLEALEQLAAIGSDNILSRGEKPQFVREWGEAQSRYANLDAKAASFGNVAAARANLTSAKNALASAIASISPAYNDTSQDSPINGAALQSLWANFYEAYAVLDVAITAQTLIVQWSADGVNWHDTFNPASDVYQRQSADNGASWGPAIRVVGEEGASGTNGQYTSIVFRRAATQPATPTSTTTPPAGWSDAPPADDGVTALWQSSADFRDGNRISAGWSTPYKVVPIGVTDFADETAANQITVTLGQTMEVPADYQGTIAAGVLPKYNQIKVMRGDIDVTTANETTYVIQNATGGCDGNVSVDNTAGSGTKGRQQIGTGFNATGSYEIVVSYRGNQAAPPIKVIVTKVLAAPPTGGGSGTEGYSNNGSFDPTGLGVGSTTMFEIGRIPAITKAAGQTQANLSFNASYTVGGTANVVRRMIAKWQVSPAAANNWTDVTAAVDGSNATYNNSTGDSTIGSISVPGTYAMGTGAFDFRVVASINATTGNASLFIESGSGAVVTS
ncbi:hypothetical protein LZK98_11585 [Sphingomonas cannabina]|uniref:hypothetical protein n=1 Tax=Sphingomonas cannabina TaxID=2899123 RepID=UPI001F2AF4D9|nr:hypothetical protein [Sphingomonas cannabina]UIJ43732.1 hypothetical protein LZK98_11585 [Sphingomonas cannabina]